MDGSVEFVADGASEAVVTMADRSRHACRAAEPNSGDASTFQCAGRLGPEWTDARAIGEHSHLTVRERCDLDNVWALR